MVLVDITEFEMIPGGGGRSDRSAFPNENSVTMLVPRVEAPEV